MQPRLIVEQRITAFANQYRVYTAKADGSKGELMAFAHQKRLAFREKVEFFTDETKSQLAFTLQAEKVMDIHGRFFVLDPEGKQIGAFKKEFQESLFISTWSILDGNGNRKLRLSESNMALAILRRYVGFVPIVGEIADLITALFKYHFTIKTVEGNAEVGRYEKTTLFYDRYKLSMTDEAYASEDSRTLAAAAVALDALQAR